MAEDGERDEGEAARRQRAVERLSAIGHLAASIGHELRNPLSVMESSLFLARRQLAELGVADARLDQQLDKIAAEVVRSRKIVDGLLGLARDQPPRRQVVALAGVVEHALAQLPEAAGVRVTTDVAPGAVIDGDIDQLAQVLVNLLQNAQQALPQGGTVTLEAGRAGAGAWLRVRDDGPGVPVALRHRLFEPLFTTKPRGSGLGLALCRRIAEAHGGTVVLEPGDRGASFLVTVPDPGA